MDLEFVSRGLAPFTFRIATERDQVEILNFFEQKPFRGKGLQLRYLRSPDFFAFLKLHSEKYFVILAYDGERIWGVATVLCRPAYIEGQVENVGYLSDLRIQPHRKYKRAWRQFYAALLKTFLTHDQTNYPKHFYTAVIDDNLPAQRALVKNHHVNFSYRALIQYRMLNLIGRKFWNLRPKCPPLYKISQASQADLVEIQLFLDQKHKETPFGYVYKLGELKRRFDSWPNYHVDNFLILRNQQLQIVACACVWSPSSTKKIVVDTLPSSLKVLRKIFPTAIPAEGGELKVSYLTDFACTLNLESSLEAQAMAAFLIACQGKVKGGYLALCDYAPFNLSRILQPYYFQYSVPMTAYDVHSSVAPVLDFGKYSALGFEIALV